MTRKKGTYIKPAADPDLRNHIQHLGLESVEEYRQWCVQHGFRTHLQKSRQQLRNELLHYRQTVVQSTLQQRKQQQRMLVEKLSGICSEETRKKTIADPLLRQICKLYQTRKGSIERTKLNRNAFLRLVAHLICCKAKFIYHSYAMMQPGYHWGIPYLDALVFIVENAESWIRPIEAWRPCGSNAYRQFASLLRHLFVKYQLPLFFDSAWLVNDAPECRNWRKWYLDVGSGRNIRHSRLPIPYTKKMAHHFMRAPQDLTILQAIRWGQILGMGGDARLARCFLRTKIAEMFLHNEFWSTVIHWFVQHSWLNRDQITSIVEYLIFQRYGIEVIPNDYWTFPEDLLKDNSAVISEYAMKGRTARSLLRDLAWWHRQQELAKREADRKWEPSGISEFDYQDQGQGNQTGKRWMIRELLNSQELQREGDQMRHCVGSYVSTCASRESSIWSMEIEMHNGFKKAITIQVVNDSRMIWQARGKANRYPNSRERAVIQRWADTNELTVASYV
ncbi:hypothetical protein Pan241w_42180 [Gimesia alba]|uniref:PcfJ-like protein n=1 Tax=Gimesia alba TaxID=2527973 RepID=A0A517RJT8_9PLAN|nr:PcfJ domain-containing protein [Gimesia alba]QDT44112.1 hypothetical protein Pan241w_42180 [Gimesia alba]